MARMTDDEVSQMVKNSISLETGHSGLIEDNHASSDISGWDSIAHIRIMYRIELDLEIEIDLRKTYSASTVGELVQLVCNINQEKGD